MLEILARRGIRGAVANDKKGAVGLLERGDNDLVFISDEISRCSGLADRRGGSFELLQRIGADLPELPVIMIAKAEKPGGQGRQQIVETAVRAIRAGCRDFLIKPLDRGKIESLLDTFLPSHGTSIIAEASEDTRSLYRIVGRSAK
jgi:DNA-binding NtrC family response regulator